MSDREKEDQFVSVTGASLQDAKHFLAMSGGDVDSAISLFFETGPLSDQGGSAAVPAEEEVRAPDAAYNDQLLGGGARRGREEVEHKDTRPDMVFGDDQEKVLDNIFKPPDEILCTDTFPKALEEGQKSQRWILVNIQDGDSFTSMALNRDIWRDETVVDIVSASFVFWQRLAKSPEGQALMQQYSTQLTQVPVICCIDPRTNRCMKVWDPKKWKEAHIAAEFLSDFLDRNSFERRRAPPPSSSPPAPAAQSAPPDPAPASKPADDKPPQNLGPGYKLSGGSEADSSLKRKREDEQAAEASKAPKTEVPKVEMPAEPASDAPDVVTVLIKLPSGERHKRRVLKNDTLEVLFQVASALTSAPISSFDLEAQFPKRSMRALGLEAKVGASDIAGSMLMCKTI